MVTAVTVTCREDNQKGPSPLIFNKQFPAFGLRHHCRQIEDYGL